MLNYTVRNYDRLTLLSNETRLALSSNERTKAISKFSSNQSRVLRGKGLDTVLIRA